MLRSIKTALAASVGLWALVGLASNISNLAGVRAKVAEVVTMGAIPGGPHWQATDSAAVIVSGAAFILLSKASVLLLSLIGAARMWAARAAPAPRFAAAKQTALAACALALLALFLGWTVIAEGWFEIWRAPALRDGAAMTALRYAAFIALIGLTIATPDD